MSDYTPKRVKRERSKGWRTPLCGCGCGKPARYVGSPSKWANNTKAQYDYYPYVSYEEAVKFYVRQLQRMKRENPNLLNELKQELGGHDLMCWCPLGRPCHADVLLDLANQQKEKNND